MELKPFALIWLILISSLILLNCNSLKSQSTFERYSALIAGIDSSIRISDYDKTFIVHFNFCTGTHYCGDNLIKYIEKNKNKKILIICDDPNNKYLHKLKNNSYKLLFIDFMLLERDGLFSVYNIEMTKKRKFRKLI